MSYLDNEYYERFVYDGLEADAWLVKNYDLLVLDIMMSKICGEVCRDIRRVSNVQSYIDAKAKKRSILDLNLDTTILEASSA